MYNTVIKYKSSERMIKLQSINGVLCSGRTLSCAKWICLWNG